MPSPVSRPCTKRHDCPADETTPIRVKRRRSLAGSQVTTQEQNPESPRGVSPGSVGVVVEPKEFLSGKNLDSPPETPPCLFQGAALLQRSKSFCQTKIETLLDGEDGSNDLIGDFTKVRKEACWDVSSSSGLNDHWSCCSAHCFL